ncbi:MAG: DUF4386 domain-containing protein [Ideonella sp. WA131b]|jgi:hypothetical protein|nr:DUF4386 domain-containing protein [Ideonella sp. WA131b]
MTNPVHAAERRPLETSASTKGATRGLGALLIADALLSFAPVVILGAAIGWPASLDKPAAEQLAAIHANAGMVTLGYGVYLLYSILVAPVMIGLAAKVFGGLQHPVAATVAAFGALSALARAIGILRWLTVMPALAAAHAAADPSTRGQIELVFTAVTTYGGGIGEVLGVALFMALSLGTLCVAALRSGGMPRWLAGLGLASTALLAGLLLPVFGAADIVPVAAAVSLLSVWMLAAGVWALRRG